jgi:hypothetical protein
MLQHPDIDRLIQQTQRYEFSDGLRDLQLAVLFLVGGATLVGELVDGRLRPDLRPAPLEPRHVGALAVALVVAAIALVANPNGIDIMPRILNLLLLRIN